MSEIVPKFHWIEGRASNAYLSEGEDGLVLIDTGMAGDAEKILNYINKIGRPFSDLRAILITHADLDHAGGAAVIQASTGATVYASRETADLLIIGKSPKHMPRFAQWIIDRFIKFTPVPKSVIHHISGGTPIVEVEDWQVIATPGHTMDHHSFFNLKQGILVAGDALNTRGGNINCTPPRITADITAAHQSARRLLRLTPAIIACGHGDPLIDFTAGDIMMLDRQLA